MAAPTFTLKVGDGLGAHMGVEEDFFHNATAILTPSIRDGDLVPVDGKLRIVPAVTVTLDAEGKLNGDTGIELLADDPSLGLDNPLQWTISFKKARAGGFSRHVKEWTFQAGSDGQTLDLAAVPPVVGVAAVGTRGPRTKAVPVDPEDPDTLYQWVDENGQPVGDPVPLSEVITTPVAEAAATAAAQTVTPGIVADHVESLEPQVVPGTTPGTVRNKLGEAVGPEFPAAVGLWEGIAARPPALDEWDIYNWKNSNTRRIQRSIAKALAGLGADHAVFGDSTSAGYVGSMNHAAAWSWVARTQLSVRGVPLGGTGWMFPCNDNAYALDPRWATSGTWTKSFGYMSTSSGSATFISDLPGTTVRIATTTTSGAYTVSVDGAAAVTITPTGSAGEMYIGEITGLADTVHTVVITRSSGTVTLHAAGVFRATGLQIHNCALIGMNAQYWAADTSPMRGWAVNRLNLNPDVIYLGLGVNDLNYSRTISQAVADLTTIREDWPDADAVLIAQPQPASNTVPTPQTDESWAAWVDALYGLADDLDVPLVDWYRVTGGSYTIANSDGLMGDLIHPNATAQALLAMTVTNALTRKAGLV